MKIVHVIEASATGTLAMASLLANSQVQSGHSVEVVFSRRPETPVDFSNYFDSSCRISQIQMYSVFEKIQSLIQLRSYFKEVAPDIIFLHSSFSGFLGRLASLCMSPKMRILYVPHCIAFMRKDVGRLKRLLFIAFEWVAAAKKADYVACSQSEQRAIRSAIPFRPCHLVENAIDFGNIPVPKNATVKRGKTVITVGQIRPQKGPDVFANIAREVRKIDPTVEFLWVGDGNSLLRSELEGAGVRVIGWVPKSQVWEHLECARLYLSTALWEGMPVSLIEASCAGLPIVASGCAGNIDVVEHGRTGWLFHEPAEASRYILRALNDVVLAREITNSAFEVARKRFDLKRYFAEMENLIS